MYYLAAKQADDQNAEGDRGELHAQRHVAVQNIAELVGDYALQLVAIEFLQHVSSDAESGAGCRETGSEDILPRVCR